MKILSFSLGLSGRSQLMNAPSLLISLVSATMTPLSAIITTGHFTLTLVGVRRSVAIVFPATGITVINFVVNRVQPLCHKGLNAFSILIEKNLPSVFPKRNLSRVRLRRIHETSGLDSPCLCFARCASRNLSNSSWSTTLSSLTSRISKTRGSA